MQKHRVSQSPCGSHWCTPPIFSNRFEQKLEVHRTKYQSHQAASPKVQTLLLLLGTTELQSESNHRLRSLITGLQESNYLQLVLASAHLEARYEREQRATSQ